MMFFKISSWIDVNNIHMLVVFVNYFARLKEITINVVRFILLFSTSLILVVIFISFKTFFSFTIAYFFVKIYLFIFLHFNYGTTCIFWTEILIFLKIFASQLLLIFKNFMLKRRGLLWTNLDFLILFDNFLLMSEHLRQFRNIFIFFIDHWVNIISF